MFGTWDSGLGTRNSSSAVSCSNAFQSPVSRLPSRGFTLLEILAVLALIGLALAVTAFSLDGGLQRAKLDASARDIAASLRHTRTLALTAHRPQWFTLDLNARSFASPGRDARGIPAGIALHVTSAAEDADKPGIARIRFFPDGSSTGGHIELARRNRQMRIDVDWLTGAVATSEKP
ncbi:MAG TPA: GspH/FimT family pseudopilin [Rhodanobacteraceae bacterium]